MSIWPSTHPLGPCPDCGRTPQHTRCECDTIGIRKQREMDARIQAENEAVGDALDEVSPGWQGDYLDAIRALAQQRDSLAAALEEAKRLARLPDSIAAQDAATAAFRALEDTSAILAARDERMRREAKVEALRAAADKIQVQSDEARVVRAWLRLRADRIEREGTNA